MLKVVVPKKRAKFTSKFGKVLFFLIFLLLPIYEALVVRICNTGNLYDLNDLMICLRIFLDSSYLYIE